MLAKQVPRTPHCNHSHGTKTMRRNSTVAACTCCTGEKTFSLETIRPAHLFCLLSAVRGSHAFFNTPFQNMHPPQQVNMQQTPCLVMPCIALHHITSGSQTRKQNSVSSSAMNSVYVSSPRLRYVHVHVHVHSICVLSSLMQCRSAIYTTNQDVIKCERALRAIPTKPPCTCHAVPCNAMPWILKSCPDLS